MHAAIVVRWRNARDWHHVAKLAHYFIRCQVIFTRYVNISVAFKWSIGKAFIINYHKIWLIYSSIFSIKVLISCFNNCNEPIELSIYTVLDTNGRAKCILINGIQKSIFFCIVINQSIMCNSSKNDDIWERKYKFKHS